MDSLINNDHEDLMEEIKILKQEKEELLEQNEKLTCGINTFNERIKEISEIYDNRNREFISEINSYKEKTAEYKKRIIILKKKIDEMYNNTGFETSKISMGNIKTKYQNGYHHIRDELDLKTQNLTPNRITFRKNDFNFLNRRKESNMDQSVSYFNEKEKNLQNQQDKFVEDYKKYLDKIGK